MDFRFEKWPKAAAAAADQIDDSPEILFICRQQQEDAVQKSLERPAFVGLLLAAFDAAGAFDRCSPRL